MNSYMGLAVACPSYFTRKAPVEAPKKEAAKPKADTSEKLKA